jgi:hypothetical protein
MYFYMENMQNKTPFDRWGSLREEIKKDFDFNEELSSFVSEYLIQLQAIAGVKECDDFKNRIQAKESNTLKEIGSMIRRKINYSKEKSRDNEERMKYVIKLELLLQKIEEITKIDK